MKTIKKISICLLSLLLLAIVPISNVFADENDDYPIMPIGQSIPMSGSYRVIYDGYYVDYSVSGTYERNNTSITNVIVNNWKANMNDNIGSQSGSRSAQYVNSWIKSNVSGKRLSITIYITVDIFTHGVVTSTETNSHTFYFS